MLELASTDSTDLTNLASDLCIWNKRWENYEKTMDTPEGRSNKDKKLGRGNPLLSLDSIVKFMQCSSSSLSILLLCFFPLKEFQRFSSKENLKYNISFMFVF